MAGRLVGLLAGLALHMVLTPGRAVRLTAVVDKTGGSASVGAYQLTAYQMALDEFEAAGGLVWRNKKVPLALKVIDTKSDKANSFTVLNDELSNENASRTDDNPLFILGGYNSARIAEQIKASDAWNAVYINGGGADPTMYKTASEGGYNTNKCAFGLLTSVSKLTSTILDYMMIQMDAGNLTKPSNIALVWEKSNHGFTFREQVSRYVLKYPEYFKLGYATDYPYPNNYTKPKDFVALAADLSHTSKKEALNALLVDAHSKDFRLLHNELWKTQLNFEFVTYGARGTGDDVTKNDFTVPISADRLCAAQWWNPSSKSQTSRDFVERWRMYEGFTWVSNLAQVQGVDPTKLFAEPSQQKQVHWYAALAYESARILLRALNQTSTQTEVGVRDYLASSVFSNTILPGGSVRFNQNGQADSQFSIVQGVVSMTDSGTVVNNIHTLYPESEKSGDFERLSTWSAQDVPCSLRFTVDILTSCDPSSQRMIVHYWVDGNGYKCPNVSEPCACTLGDFQLPASIKIDCEYLAVDSQQGTAVVVLCSIGAFICFASLTILLIQYNHVVMKAGQREFLALMCFAGIWCNIAGISFLGPNESGMCITRVFSLLFSVALLVGALTVKVYRIYKIWNNSSMKRIIITAFDMLKLLSVLMLGMFIIFLVWMLVERPHAITESLFFRVAGHQVETELQVCQYNRTAIFPSLSIAYIVLILVYCNILSFQGRNSDAKYMESRSIMAASYCISFIILLVVILIVTADLPAASTIVLIALSLVFTSVLFVGLVLGPKLYFAASVGIKDVKEKVRRKFTSGPCKRSSTTENNDTLDEGNMNTTNSQNSTKKTEAEPDVVETEPLNPTSMINLPTNVSSFAVNPQDTRVVSENSVQVS
uniref:G-protein coupled receptors family 3 profile domain-containing protein n=1 Tax=Mucochytrium quahogii TaxID=96639 RepID=A0A7S2WLK5_9STRA|mmetsp:Transcript_14923/g.26075  ORF Transcript_14923/g.26075 Transcript_14923/m.26075 type:complete len:880 (-) Transcript_14923:789-3428(-)|eukprot:CAMPEP_0203744862 /NCGR_PEP_ID=MMETSP0098-20131031/783_1 /ASSEMBLY_ACC=CAM_ASM_000208 /TAXON_ID=96639 /ORGANISM=" , Strain NY0313808BC1" /LENGTH=879 /DNA_ID=CAMNT_0050632487 /DNA_START=358 /DNA_END=2997 /DNA_ORIENTATION=+